MAPFIYRGHALSLHQLRLMLAEECGLDDTQPRVVMDETRVFLETDNRRVIFPRRLAGDVSEIGAAWHDAEPAGWA